MEKVTVETKEVKKVTRTCDDCGAEIKKSLACSVARCEICKADLCDNCVAHENETGGDYRECYCDTCWTAGHFFREEIEHLSSAIDREVSQWNQIGKQLRTVNRLCKDWLCPGVCRRCNFFRRPEGYPVCQNEKEMIFLTGMQDPPENCPLKQPQYGEVQQELLK